MATYQDNLSYPTRTVHGNDWFLPVTISNLVNLIKVPVDLTAAVITGVVKANSASVNVLQTMTVTPVDLVNGRFLMGLTDTQTSALGVGAYYYQIDVTIGTNTTTYLAGNFISR